MVESEQKETTIVKRTFKKSRPYPPVDVEEAVKFSAIIEKLGARNVSETVILKELGLTAITNTFWGKTASAKHFGLITVDGKTYTLTDRAKLILRPKDEDGKKRLLLEAFLMPDLYRELYEKFIDKQIPSLDTLSNILFHDHGINANVSKNAAEAFIESAKFVGLLGADNVLKSSAQKGETATIIEHEAVDTLKRTPARPVSTNMPPIPIKLSKGMASIVLPEGGITQKDSERLKKLIDIYVVEEEQAGE